MISVAQSQIDVYVSLLRKQYALCQAYMVEVDELCNVLRPLVQKETEGPMVVVIALRDAFFELFPNEKVFDDSCGDGIKVMYRSGQREWGHISTWIASSNSSKYKHISARILNEINAAHSFKSLAIPEGDSNEGMNQFIFHKSEFDPYIHGTRIRETAEDLIRRLRRYIALFEKVETIGYASALKVYESRLRIREKAEQAGGEKDADQS